MVEVRVVLIQQVDGKATIEKIMIARSLNGFLSGACVNVEPNELEDLLRKLGRLLPAVKDQAAS